MKLTWLLCLTLLTLAVGSFAAPTTSYGAAHPFKATGHFLTGGKSGVNGAASQYHEKKIARETAKIESYQAKLDNAQDDKQREHYQKKLDKKQRHMQRHTEKLDKLNNKNGGQGQPASPPDPSAGGPEQPGGQ